MPAALRIASQILEALDSLGRAERASGDGVERRDEKREVSPRTILLSPLGDARLVESSKSNAGSTDTAWRAAYLAPEAIGGWGTDRRGDLFSVGAVLYEMLTGKRLFSLSANLEALARTREADLSAIAAPTQRLPLELRLILASALAREPDERFQAPCDFADAIQSFAQHVRISLERGVVASWLATLDVWPMHSGTYSKADLEGLSETHETEDSIQVHETRAR
jgi:serine/threonine protein kinase